MSVLHHITQNVCFLWQYNPDKKIPGCIKWPHGKEQKWFLCFFGTSILGKQPNISSFNLLFSSLIFWIFCPMENIKKGHKFFWWMVVVWHRCWSLLVDTSHVDHCLRRQRCGISQAKQYKPLLISGVWCDLSARHWLSSYTRKATPGAVHRTFMFQPR